MGQVVHGCGRKFADKHWEQTDRRRDWGDDGTPCAACQEQKAATEMAAKIACTARRSPSVPCLGPAQHTGALLKAFTPSTVR
ncbi:hypothetical protein ACWCY1_35660 [Streptomyces goshikiensis]|uniref:hypothetical protein n=1 Tax=Streptomyces goshikiensis TaxID=1942 RepID=UPI0036D8DBDA